MFGFPILEVAIGLSFIYLLLSLICTTVNETIATLTRRRSKVLEKAITNIIGDPKLKNELYSHPVIKSLSEGGKPPSYIPAPKFAVAREPMDDWSVIGAITCRILTYACIAA